VLLLAEWEGLSAAEISAVLGCLTVTARGRLHRARRRFRQAFDELASTHEDEQPPAEDADLRPTPVWSQCATTFAKEDL
jgi:DNA-directed RNA polymerase specialized sigma24 family protein